MLVCIYLIVWYVWNGDRHKSNDMLMQFRLSLTFYKFNTASRQNRKTIYLWEIMWGNDNIIKKIKDVIIEVIKVIARCCNANSSRREIFWFYTWTPLLEEAFSLRKLNYSSTKSPHRDAEIFVMLLILLQFMENANDCAGLLIYLGCGSGSFLAFIKSYHVSKCVHFTF